MKFLDLAKERYSVRNYLQKEIEEEKIQIILEAAKVAPTACNKQPQRIYILKTKESLEKIRNITKNAYNAPVVFLICADMEESWHSPFVENYNSGEMDASIICTHMMLQAKDIGLDSVWVVSFDMDKTAKEFNLPENIKPICLLPVGYAKEDAKPTKNHNIFISMEKMVKEI